MNAPRVASAVARTTSMTAMIDVKMSTRGSDRKDCRSKPLDSFEPVASEIVPPTVEKTPMASMTIHSTAAATIVQMPSAMESRKLTFITDQGSALATRRRALRVRGVVLAPVRGWRTAPDGGGCVGYACGGWYG